MAGNDIYIYTYVCKTKLFPLLTKCFLYIYINTYKIKCQLEKKKLSLKSLNICSLYKLAITLCGHLETGVTMFDVTDDKG